MNPDMAGGREPGKVLNSVVITSAVDVVELQGRPGAAPTSTPVALRVEDLPP